MVISPSLISRDPSICRTSVIESITDSARPADALQHMSAYVSIRQHIESINDSACPADALRSVRMSEAVFRRY